MFFKSVSFVSYLLSCVLIVVVAMSLKCCILTWFTVLKTCSWKNKQTNKLMICENVFFFLFVCLFFVVVFSLKPLAAAAAKSLQSCLTLGDSIDSSPQGSPVPGILQARTLEWVAISFSNAWKWKVKVKSLSRVRIFPTPWTAAHQLPPSIGFARQEYWSGVPSPPPKPLARDTNF